MNKGSEWNIFKCCVVICAVIILADADNETDPISSTPSLIAPRSGEIFETSPNSRVSNTTTETSSPGQSGSIQSSGSTAEPAVNGTFANAATVSTTQASSSSGSNYATPITETSGPEEEKANNNGRRAKGGQNMTTLKSTTLQNEQMTRTEEVKDKKAKKVIGNKKESNTAIKDDSNLEDKLDSGKTESYRNNEQFRNSTNDISESTRDPNVASTTSSSYDANKMERKDEKRTEEGQITNSENGTVTTYESLDNVSIRDVNATLENSAEMEINKISTRTNDTEQKGYIDTARATSTEENISSKQGNSRVTSSKPDDTTSSKPETTSTKPVNMEDTTSTKPVNMEETTSTKPVTTSTKPVNMEDTTSTKPVNMEETTSTKPVTTSTKPVTTSTKPVNMEDTTSTKPVNMEETTSTKPVTTSTKPVTTSTKPETTSTKTVNTEETTSTKPVNMEETTSTKPINMEEPTSTKPETTSTKPETTSTKPETTSTNPETTSTKPETTSTKPETTSTKPVKMEETTSTKPVKMEETTNSKPVTTDESTSKNPGNSDGINNSKPGSDVETTSIKATTTEETTTKIPIADMLMNDQPIRVDNTEKTTKITTEKAKTNEKTNTTNSKPKTEVKIDEAKPKTETITEEVKPNTTTEPEQEKANATPKISKTKDTDPVKTTTTKPKKKKSKKIKTTSTTERIETTTDSETEPTTYRDLYNSKYLFKDMEGSRTTDDNGEMSSSTETTPDTTIPWDHYGMPFGYGPWMDGTFGNPLWSEEEPFLQGPDTRSKELRINGEIKIIEGEEWTPDLEQTDTIAFGVLAAKVKQQLKQLYAKTTISKVLKRIEITGFKSKEGILVTYNLLLQTASDLISRHYLVNVFNKHLKDRSKLGPYTLDPKSTSFDLEHHNKALNLTDTSDEDPTIPQWAIAFIVVAAACLIFSLMFAAVTVYGRSHGTQNNAIYDREGMVESCPGWERKLAAAYENIAADSVYDNEDGTRSPNIRKDSQRRVDRRDSERDARSLGCPEERYQVSDRII